MTRVLSLRQNVLSEDAFLDKAAALMEEHCHERFKLTDTRQLLERSPLSMGVFIDHAELLAELLHEVGMDDSSDCSEEDARLLAGYLNAIANLAPSVLLQCASHIAGWSHPHGRFIARKPMYDGLMNVMHGLSTPEGIGRTHPVLLKSISLGLVDPMQLSGYLSSFTNEQLEYLSDIHNTSNSFQYTAHGKWLFALRPLMLDFNWRPNHDEVYAQLWLVHDNESTSAGALLDERNSAFMRLMAQGHDAYLHFGLWHLLKVSHASDAVLDAFFPLSLDKCETVQVLTHLLGLSFGNSSKSERFTQRLVGFHPELANILQMHLLIFPNVELALAHASAMVEPFERLWTGPQELVVGDDLFETQA